MVDSVSVRFKNARVEKVPLSICIQWNAGTACENAGIHRFSQICGHCSRLRLSARAEENRLSYPEF